MVAAFEVLIATNPVRNLIREGRSNQLLNIMTTNQKEGMRTLEISLAELIIAGTVTYEDALDVSAHPKELARALEPVQRRTPELSDAMASRAGPELPYSVVAGVTPCAPGWLVASAKLNGATFAPELPAVLATFTEVLDERPSFSVIALNAPIGYVDETRRADGPATAWLGPSRSTWLDGPQCADLGPTLQGGCRAGRRTASMPISTALLPRYREVAAEMAPYRQRTVFEVHPELSFFQINGDVPLRWTKKFEVGREERRALLMKKIPGIDRAFECEFDDVPWRTCSMPPHCCGRLDGYLPVPVPAFRRPRMGRRGIADGVRPLRMVMMHGLRAYAFSHVAFIG